MNTKQDLIPHLFRSEFSKIVVVLCNTFGLDHMEIAEDIVSETFATALETWPHHGIPEKPASWLYAVAKNKTLNFLNREQIFQEKVARQIKDSLQEIKIRDIDLSDQNIIDSQLQMLFAICHQSISKEAQIGLALRILCGFDVKEISNAFLTSETVIYKRLYRARKTLRKEQIDLKMPSNSEMNNRLETILATLYLLFNEGYYSESNNQILRNDLCLEAMRLNFLLLSNDSTAKPAVYALLALMCFHASRFEARKNEQGEMILYHEQDESLWDHDLIAKGAWYFKQSSQGETISKYHLEAGIAWWHTIKNDTKEKWGKILRLYNQLLTIDESPIVALNRIYAIYKVNGKKVAITEAEKLNLSHNRYYHTLLGELYKGTDDIKSKYHFQNALRITKIKSEKIIISQKIRS